MFFKSNCFRTGCEGDCCLDLPWSILLGVWSSTFIVFLQAGFQVVRDSGVMLSVVLFGNENINVMKLF